jgi:malyl-CoA/(S)-citramalyl-CoA lyase
MSFTLIQQATPRLHRSELAVPGSNPTFMEKSAASKADVIFLDLEDAVAPDDKEQARKNIIQALNDLDWGNKTMMIRINGLDTHYMYRDVVDIVEACPRLDMILIPKVGVPADVYAIDVLTTQIEQAKKREKKIGFEVLIETALGMANVEAIATSSKRLEAMSFGVADYAASTRARSTVIGGVNADYSVLTDKDEAGNRQTHWQDPTACARSTVPSATSPIRTATPRPLAAAPRSASRASGRSTPRRSIWPTRSSPPPRPRSPRPAASWKPWKRPPRPAAAPSRSTAASSTSPRSAWPRR